jgi:hypothetical protein
VTTAWAVVLLVGAVWWALDGSPTVREQTTVAQAQSTVDKAVGLVVVAAGPDAVAAISGYAQVDSCSITPLRGGARYDREVWLATPPGTEPDLLRRIARELPAGYHAYVTPPTAAEKSRLSADAGDYVAVAGTVDRPGLVMVSAATGCRPLGHRPATDPSGTPAPADRAVAEQALAAFGITPVRWATHRLPCGVTTLEADGPTRPAGPLPTPSPSTGAPVVHRDDVYAQRPGLMVRLDVDHAVLTLTTGACQ